MEAKNKYYSQKPGPIGVFDSGYGGLTIFDKIRSVMPDYDYIYLGDNARTPYGTRSFEVVYQFTRQAVMKLFEEGCQLVILACNTASAKALRTIQQRDLPGWDEERRVLGVIRPTVELMDTISKTKHIGILGTNGTISSGSYTMEIGKMFPHIKVTGEACPMWVPLVENNEFDSPGADYFVKKHLEHVLSADPEIDTLVLGCTHYPLLINKIEANLPKGITLFSQGEYVAKSLQDYLRRHSEMDARLTKEGRSRFLTTESAEKFSEAASLFLSDTIQVEQVSIDR
ncbi:MULTISPECIES: glutamate racemase [Parabacteroides]|uniref:glutamate racemase n=1 Tax=Parabacteroides provencensis TaxID=1944636 RepID=UPI000C149110|nr:glutamate racemase [Parabacteroides provencensis]